MASSDLAERTLAALVELLDSSGWHPDVLGDAILVHPLGLTVTAETHDEGGSTDIRCVVIHTVHHELFPQGVHEHSVGLGKSDDEVAFAAAEGWLGQVFATMHSLVCGEGDTDVRVMDLVTCVNDTDEVFGWRAHVSAPSNYALNGVLTGTQDHMEFMKDLLGPLSATLVDRTVHSLKCFLGILPSGTVHSEARFDGVSWDEGTRALNDCAARWLRQGNHEIRKQFMLFAPCDLSDLKAGDDLAEQVRAEGRRIAGTQ